MNRAVYPQTMRILAGALMGSLLLCAAAPRAEGLWTPHGTGHDLLAATQAFHLVSAARQGDTVTVAWDIAPGYYLYRQRLAFHIAAPVADHLQAAQLPAGERIGDEQGQSEIYRGSLQAALRWTGKAPPQQLRVQFQGCAEVGVCYPPQSQLIDVVDLGG